MRGLCASVTLLCASFVPGAESNRAALFGVKDATALQMHIHVYAGQGTVIGIDGKWKAMSVQVNGGAIAAVEMVQGTSDQISPQFQEGGNFFQAADLGGQMLQWDNGHAATVTFEAGTDMSTVFIEYDSFNTYIVQLADISCVTSCKALPAIYFEKLTAIVALSGETSTAGANTYEVYVFADAAEVRQVSVGFSHQDVSDWSFDHTLPPMDVVDGDDAFVPASRRSNGCPKCRCGGIDSARLPPSCGMFEVAVLSLALACGHRVSGGQMEWGCRQVCSSPHWPYLPVRASPCALMQVIRTRM